MTIITALNSSSSVVISAEVQQQLWRLFFSLVAIYESPQASSIPFYNVVCIITLNVHPLELILDLPSKTGLVYIKFPPSFMSKIYDFCDMQLKNPLPDAQVTGR